MFFKRRVDNLEVYCKMKDRGCKWVGELKYQQSHLTSVGGCSFVETDCEFSYAGCTTRPLWGEVEKHVQESIQEHLLLLLKKVQRNEEMLRGQRDQITSEFQKKLESVQKSLETRLFPLSCGGVLYICAVSLVD